MTMPRSRGPSADILAARCVADLLQIQAAQKPGEVVYTYLDDDESADPRTLTFGELYDDARRVATLLLQHVQPGDRAILLFGSGLDFVLAFMGCQVAGIVPVPVMPPRDATPAELGRVMAILDDVGTTLIVTSEQLIQMGRAFLQVANLNWLSVEQLDGVEMTEPIAFEDAGELALLQYTSGSTSRPRGVMVGHDNLLCNLADIYWAEGNGPDTISVSWLPMSHDMGLIEGVLQPLYRGGPVFLMSPVAFLRRPLRWLEVISEVGATVSGGPNFAYDLVLRRVGHGPVPDLDLSRWRFAYNGSEPVCAETIDAFSRRFACRGFRPESVHPLYGNAEATLGVTEGRHQQPPRVQHRVGPGGTHPVVSCGTTAPHTELVIVDPETNRALADGEEGEIWVNGPCVTRGYWRQPEQTRDTFQARIEGRDRPYLRTGDLGFIVDGEVYISGRLKEVIVSRGRNVYPQDMELTAQKAHAAIRPGGVVAFAIPGREEAAGVVAELDKRVWAGGPDPVVLGEIAGEVRRSVTVAHGVPVAMVALVKPGALPRTTSGKRQRLKVAKMWTSGTLEPLHVLQHDGDAPDDDSVQSFLTERAAGLLGVAPDALDPSCTLAELGLDSSQTLELLLDVEARFGGISLADMLTRRLGDLAAKRREDATEPWLRDAVLADDVRCARRERDTSFGRVLVTGATGFVGGHVTTRLLATTEDTIVALVRGGRERLLAALARHPDWRPEWEARVEVVDADIAQLEPTRLEALGGLDAIFHIAAMVNWVYPYPALSATNVAGTEALLRFACNHATPFVYVSTSAVCWSYGATTEVDEDTDPMGHIDGIHLDYVRTKAVAETLVRQAAARGLPATIVRPGLVFSHTETGAHSPGDFLSALFKGCIEMGVAPDLDWSLETCAVDDVARIVVDHVRREPGVTTLHAESAPRRLWRGAVLWMALRGYDVELLPYDAWCERLLSHEHTALRPLQPFFTRPVPGLGGLRVPELYEEPRRNPMSSRRIEGLAPLDAHLLDKTFDQLVDCGYLPAPRAESGARERVNAGFEAILRRHFDDATLELLDETERGWDGGSAGEHGIIGELASWRHGRDAGVRRVSLRVRSGGTERELIAVVKTCVPDHHTLDVGHAVATLCAPALGEAWQQHRARSEVCGSHLREAAIYALEDDALSRHRPILYGADDGLLLLEDLTGMALLNSAGAPWDSVAIAAAIEGIAAVHARWLGSPPTDAWLPPDRRCAEQQSLWDALADLAIEQCFARNLGPSGIDRYQALLAAVEQWSEVQGSMPQTLIHNDFNPRNIALRPDGRLCAYDWELARVGLPQRDLAELLCFTLAPDTDAATLTHWVQLHRELLQDGGHEVDEATWRLGFGAALADLMVTRLPLYAMISRFHPQPFLDRVVQTWSSLDRHMGFGR